MVHLKLENNNHNITPEEGFAILSEEQGYKIRLDVMLPIPSAVLGNH